VRRVAFLALVGALAAGCGSAAGGSGRATVWITRDRGKVVLHRAKVPSGLTAMQALARVAKLETRYGGRYVRAVDGVEEGGRRAWFYYVNGYLADRGAADYRLHTGDVEWWDYRSWRDPADDPVVVGAFPEPFLHGYGGKMRPAIVVTNEPSGRMIARRLRAKLMPSGARLPRGANVLVLKAGNPTTFRVMLVGGGPGSPVRMTFTGDPRSLLRYRFRYSVP
jgi:Domain of unknown function (DUF4430)